VYIAATYPRFLFSFAHSEVGWLGYLTANEAMYPVRALAGARKPLQSAHWKDSVHLEVGNCIAWLGIFLIYGRQKVHVLDSSV